MEELGDNAQLIIEEIDDMKNRGIHIYMYVYTHTLYIENM
jgi:hypothetical protein